MIPYIYNSFSALLLVAIATILSSVVHSQEHTIRSLTYEDGLSQNDVNCIYEDVYGYMWFSTHDGLSMYDGHDFTIYRHNPRDITTINSSIIHDIVGDEHGNLWIATWGKGLDYFDRYTGTFTHYRHNKGKYGLSSDYVDKLWLDKSGHLWIATDGGFNHINLNEDKVQIDKIDISSHVPEIEHSIMVYSIYEDYHGKIWLGGLGGIYEINEELDIIDYHLLHDEAGNLLMSKVNDLTQDLASSQILVGAEVGLYNLVGTTEASKKLVKIRSGNIRTLALDPQQVLWIGTDDGLLKLDVALKLETIKSDDVTDCKATKILDALNIRDIHIDPSGLLWIATWAEGAKIMSLHERAFGQIYLKDLDGHIIRSRVTCSFEDSKGFLWLSSGPFLFVSTLPNQTADDQKFRQVLKHTSDILALEEVREKKKGFLYIGSSGDDGIYSLDISKMESLGTQKLKLLQKNTKSIFSIKRTLDKSLWFGSFLNGIYRYKYEDEIGNYKKDNIKNRIGDAQSLASNVIRDIEEDKKGNIWIATDRGLSLLTFKERYRDKPNFKNYYFDITDPRSIDNDYILDIAIRDNGEIWLGTFGGGLIKMHEDKPGDYWFETFNDSDGLPSGVVKTIVEDDEGMLWLTTNAGITRFNPASKALTNYGRLDGLASLEYSESVGVKRKSGTLVFGNLSGFSEFDPGDVRSNYLVSKTVITDFLLFDESISPVQLYDGKVILNQSLDRIGEIKLEHDHNSFGFQFSALNFESPEKTRFAYILEGYDDDWKYTSAEVRKATYANLSPGNYKFKVKSSSGDDLWDDTPREISIEVMKPYYATVFAFLLYGLVVAFILYMIRRYRRVLLIYKERRDIESMRRQSQEELTRSQLVFFTNIIQKLRSPINLLFGPISLVCNNFESLSKDEIVKLLGVVQKNSKSLANFVEDFLHYRQLDTGDAKLILKYGNMSEDLRVIFSKFESFTQAKGVYYSIELEEDDLHGWYDPFSLEKIMISLFFHSLKHLDTNRRIQVKISSLIHQGLSPDEYQDQPLVRIAMSYYGRDISEGQGDRIFDKYQSGKRASLNKELGYSLTYTKTLVDQLQGSIKIESKKNGRNSFILTLPLDKRGEQISVESYTNPPAMDVLDVEAMQDDSKDVNNSCVGSGQGEKVLLIVDHNDDMRTFLSAGLKKVYNIVESKNGIHAWEKIQVSNIDIILCDVSVPGISGKQLCEKVKSSDRFGSIPFYLLTSNYTPSCERAALGIGADNLISKPVDIDMLLLRLANSLYQRQNLLETLRREALIAPVEVKIKSKDLEFIEELVHIVETHLSNPELNVEFLAMKSNKSRSSLHTKVTSIMGMTTSELIRDVRLKRAYHLLKTSDLTVKEVMHMVGFNSSSYFAKCFKSKYDVLPSERDKLVSHKAESV